MVVALFFSLTSQTRKVS